MLAKGKKLFKSLIFPANIVVDHLISDPLYFMLDFFVRSGL